MGKDIRRSCNVKQFLLSPLWVKKLRNSCLQCRRPGFDPWVRKIPWRRKWQPILVLLPGKSHGQRSLVDYSPWDLKESDTTEWFHFHFLSVFKSFALDLVLLWFHLTKLIKQNLKVSDCSLITILEQSLRIFLRIKKNPVLNKIKFSSGSQSKITRHANKQENTI